MSGKHSEQPKLIFKKSVWSVVQTIGRFSFSKDHYSTKIAFSSRASFSMKKAPVNALQGGTNLPENSQEGDHEKAPVNASQGLYLSFHL